MEETLIQHRINNSIATITLNRPTALNALNNDMIADLIVLLKRYNHEKDIRVVVLEGNGRSFCAGDDLVDMGTEKNPNPPEKLAEYREGYPELVLQMRALEKPVIAKIHGHALGAGFEMALGADIIIASKKTKMGLPFVLRGIAAGTYLLPQILGYHKASELLFTGEMLSSEEALKLGIINKVVEDEDLDQEVKVMAEMLATGATRAMGLMKIGLNRSITKSMEEAFNEQAYLTTMSYHTGDFGEGKMAFSEKREPKFKGE